MKRFHVHVAVNELAQSVRFYSAVFGAEPSVLKDDYAKWMLDDPRINFAISKRGQKPGVDHLGLQVEGKGELDDMRGRLETADGSLIEQTAQPCCYAKSDKYWITDPQGIAWETFHTLESIPMFGEDTQLRSAASACCVPVAQITRKESDESAACCVPTLTNAAAGSSTCC
jgi:catechol 2,3-dioxygenase-like lactoylglutathione lyase family enzyme